MDKKGEGVLGTLFLELLILGGIVFVGGILTVSSYQSNTFCADKLGVETSIVYPNEKLDYSTSNLEPGYIRCCLDAYEDHEYKPYCEVHEYK